MRTNGWMRWGVVAVVSSGCASFATFQEVDTLAKKSGEVGVGATVSGYTVDLGGEDPQSLIIPAVNVWGRYGITERLEAHGRIWLPLGATVGGKVQLLGDRTRPGFGLSTGLDVGYLSIGSGGSNTTVVDTYVPLYLGLRASEGFSTYLVPKYLLRTSLADAGSTISHQTGGTLGLAAGNKTKFFLEGSGIYDLTGSGSESSHGIPGGYAVQLFHAIGTTIENNWIGTTPDGLAQGNPYTTIGISFDTENYDTVIRGNLISGILAVARPPHSTSYFVGTGIQLWGSGSGVTIVGNKIGLNANDEPLLGSAAMWAQWFELSGLRIRVNPVAAFNDAGLMLQAAEQGLGLALGRELFAADALRDGRLVRLSPLALPDDETDAFWLAYPPTLADWPPLVALRDWLKDELAQSRLMLEGGQPAR